MNSNQAYAYDRPKERVGTSTPARHPGAPVEIAVVGHTNVGKTSLLRTLLRDVDFGEVSHKPSTTRHVEGAALRIHGETLLVLHDTPGLEDGIGLKEYLARLSALPEAGGVADPMPVMASTGGLGSTPLQPAMPRLDRLDGPDSISAFLHSAEARGHYEQEAKVLRQMLAVHAAIYVVDVREPVLPKYRDELAVLAMTGKPLLPVFNFVLASETHEAAWRDVLARVGLHVAVRFDTVAPPLDGEQRLYDSLALLLERARPVLDRLRADLAAQAQERRLVASRLMAELLIDVAAARLHVASDEQAIHTAVQALHDAVRQREQRCTQALLALYAFRRGDATTHGFPSFEGAWADDLFNAETLKQFGIRLSGGMAAGAAIGAGLDVMLAGLSLGTATLVGALAGGAFQTLRDYGQRFWGRMHGERVLRVDDPVLRLLAVRQILLAQALEARGHAAQQAISIDDLAHHAQAAALGSQGRAYDWRQDRLPEPLEKARAHPEWSSLNDAALRAAAPGGLQSTERQIQLGGLMQALMSAPGR